MIYDLDNTIRAGKPVDRVVDANGVEYQKVLSIDTETGRIELIDCDENGNPLCDYDKGEVKRRVVQAALPITVTFR